MIGQLHSVVLDAPDAHALAGFYAQLLGMDVKGSPGDDWVVVTGAGYRIAFQQAPDLRPRTGPTPSDPSSSTWTSGWRTSTRRSRRCWPSARDG